jgi:FCD domain
MSVIRSNYFWASVAFIRPQGSERGIQSSMNSTSAPSTSTNATRVVPVPEGSNGARIIRNAAGSRIVTDVIRLCQRIPQTAARNVMAFDLEDVRLRHDDHHQIYEAIICREPKEAESLMRAHVSRVKTAMIRAFAELDKDSSSSLAS